MQKPCVRQPFRMDAPSRHVQVRVHTARSGVQRNQTNHPSLCCLCRSLRIGSSTGSVCAFRKMRWKCRPAACHARWTSSCVGIWSSEPRSVLRACAFARDDADVSLRVDLDPLSQAGDRCIFAGSLVVVPDVAQLAAPGEKVEIVNKVDTRNPTEGIAGLKALGVESQQLELARAARYEISAHGGLHFAGTRADLQARLPCFVGAAGGSPAWRCEHT